MPEKRGIISNLKYIMAIMIETAPFFLILTVLSSLFAGLGNVVQSYLLSKIIDGILNMIPFKVIAIYAVVIIIFQLIAKLQNRTLFAMNRVVTEEIGIRMESGILNHAEDIPLSKMDTPGFLNRMEQARGLARQTPNSIFMLLFGAIGFIVGTIGYVVILSQISILYVLILVACSVLIFMANNRYEENVMASLFALSPERRKMGYYADLITKRDSFEEVHAYGAVDYLRKQYQINAKKQLATSRNIFRRYTGFYSIAALVAYAGCALVYLLIIRKAVMGQISIGDTTMFLTACLSFQAGLTELFDGICSLPAQLGILENYRNFMDELTAEREGTEEAGKHQPSAVLQEELVKVEDLSFAYPNTQRNVLNHVSFQIKPGECVALVGTNGSGKTTLARLLAGFYDCYEGSIVIEGMEAASAKECASIAMMFQNYLKPSMTVGESVAYGETDSTNEAAVQEALERSGYPLEHFPEGLATNLTKTFDQKGIIPSGGQWQKLALARMFYRNAPLYILDEPSASLDPQAEDEVFQTLAEMKGEHAILFITHRLASVSVADRVLYLTQEGTLIQGTHKELMECCPAYKDLYETQSKKYIQGREGNVGDSAV